MNGIISNGIIIDEVRPGWALNCPSCGQEVRYTVLNLSGGREPFLYCDSSSDFVLRDEDIELVVDRAGEVATPTIEHLGSVYDDLESILDACPAGGSFRRWANARCPHCNQVFPYNSGLQSEDVRYMESRVIWIEGAIAYRGAKQPSNRLITVQT